MTPENDPQSHDDRGPETVANAAAHPPRRCRRCRSAASPEPFSFCTCSFVADEQGGRAAAHPSTQPARRGSHRLDLAKMGAIVNGTAPRPVHHRGLPRRRGRDLHLHRWLPQRVLHLRVVLRHSRSSHSQRHHHDSVRHRNGAVRQRVRRDLRRAVHVVVVTNIDNFLRPVLVPREARLDSALMLLSVFSGYRHVRRVRYRSSAPY